MNTIYLDGTSLTFDQVSAVAYEQPNAPHIEISAEAAKLVTRVVDAAQTLLECGVIAYGITTGFGTFKDRIIPTIPCSPSYRLPRRLVGGRFDRPWVPHSGHAQTQRANC